jgi:hypothetical protein
MPKPKICVGVVLEIVTILRQQFYFFDNITTANIKIDLSGV